MNTGPEGWLIGERPLPGHTGDPNWFFSSLPADTSLQRLVELAHSRWAIEQFYEEAKGECGLDRYQGRRWDGLHRHLALVTLAYSFLILQSVLPQPRPPAGADGTLSPSMPSARGVTLPAAHRLVLVWLFQDLVHWLINTDQIRSFRPRRN